MQLPTLGILSAPSTYLATRIPDAQKIKIGLSAGCTRILQLRFAIRAQDSSTGTVPRSRYLVARRRGGADDADGQTRPTQETVLGLMTGVTLRVAIRRLVSPRLAVARQGKARYLV